MAWNKMRGGYQSRDRHGPGSERTVAFARVNEYHPYRGADRYIPRARPISREPYSHRFSSFRHHGPSYRERQPPRQNERWESAQDEVSCRPDEVSRRSGEVSRRQDEERSIARPNAPASTLRSTSNRVLSDEDVIAVAEWVTRWLDHGFYLENQKKISAFVRHYMHMINHPNKDVGVSDSFYGRLSPRSRELSNRVEQACKIWKEQIKRKNENKTAKEDRLAKFPALLKGLERTLDVSPDRVFVVGDTGFLTVMSLENQNLRVEASARNEGDHRRIASAIICASNDGQYLSPYLVSKTEAVNKKPARVSKAFVSFAAKPWVNTEFFNDWLEKVFEPETKRLAGNKRERLARLLLVDGQLYEITPSTFMNCWSKGIYLVCIPHKGSPFFNPLECTVFSKMHEIYVTEMAEKFRKASGMLIVSYRFVANSLIEQLQRQLLQEALKAGWRKSHLYTSDHDALRKHVRRIPATPAPVTPIKTRARTLAQSQLDQAVPISPPQSTQQPSERRCTRQSQNETLEKPSDDERDLDSQRRPITVNKMSSEQRLARDSGSSRPRCHPQAPSHIRYHSVSSEDPESSTDGSEDDFNGDEEYQDDASRGSSAYEAALSQMTPVCDKASIAMEESPIFSQRSDSIPLPCKMSGGLQCSSGSSRTQSPQVASSVEIPCARHSSQSSWEEPNTPVNNQLPTPNPLLGQHQERVGGSLEVVYREHVQALSNPKTPESQRKVYEQTLLDLAPILCAVPISAAEALHRFAQMSYSRQDSSSPSRPHAPRVCQDAKIKKTPRTKRREGHRNVH